MLPSKYLEQGWTQNKLAVDQNDRQVEPLSPKAIRWSLRGAILASVKDESIDLELYNKGLVLFINAHTDTWNNSQYRQKEEVITIAKQVEAWIDKFYLSVCSAAR